jgi:hypothetical protein
MKRKVPQVLAAQNLLTSASQMICSQNYVAGGEGTENACFIHRGSATEFLAGDAEAFGSDQLVSVACESFS